jgi:hypothetical protein
MTSTDGWKAESKFIFNKRGKLKENEVLEMKKTHKSLKDWIKPNKIIQSGVESVKVRVSHFEELDLHGGAHTPLLGPATITEKGVGLGQVIGLQTTGDQTAHTPVPGTQIDLQNVRINCIQCTHTVQCQQECTDPEKVKSVLASTVTGNAQSMTGLEEDFSTNIDDIRQIWDRLENDEDEWKVEEGWRRGGRKVSRRMSELIDRFEGEEYRDQPNLTVGDNSVSEQTLISHTMGRGADIHQNLKRNNVVRSRILVSEDMNSERCDWPTDINIQLISTNERQARSQVADRNMNNGSAVQIMK